MRFDIVVGNPPYQENVDYQFSNKANPIYPKFYDLAKTVGKAYCLISPARFLFGIGATDSAWNQSMLDDKNLTTVFYTEYSNSVFPNTDIKGGVAVLYRGQEPISIGGGYR